LSLALERLERLQCLFIGVELVPVIVSASIDDLTPESVGPMLAEFSSHFEVLSRFCMMRLLSCDFDVVDRRVFVNKSCRYSNGSGHFRPDGTVSG
jgi:hypothetical protein